ncbi:MAG: filamentous hemagglutinin N-terminal domain-containing protein [Cyanobacteria bacterium P01_F01_bin.143]
MSLILISPAKAQIVPDNSLGAENSIVTPQDALTDLIEGGAIRDHNLFHSFSEFNINDGARVDFANPEGITNILTRVTGNNISEILGTLSIDGGANLFLLNPNGIIFGENARLDLNGSFFATTAESYIFDQGQEFSSIQANPAPLLTVTLTPGLQIGNNSGSITVQNQGHKLTGGFFFPYEFNDIVDGLQVSENNTIGLIANGINLTGGIILVPGGNIELTSVEEGLVKFQPQWELDTSEVTKFADIRLSNKSLIDTGGLNTGDLKLQGKNIILENGSVAVIRNLGTNDFGNIQVKATESIDISGSILNGEAPPVSSTTSSPTGVIYSGFVTENLGSQQGGNIIVSGNNLFLSGGGAITTQTFSNVRMGSIDVDINELIAIENLSSLNPTIISRITSSIYGRGHGGMMKISAKNLQMSDGGILAALNFGGLNEGGDVEVNVAENIIISGYNKFNFAPTFISSSTFGLGNSGDLIINTNNLILSDGGTVASDTLAVGNAGTLTVNATESINISGQIPKIFLVSGIKSNTPIYSPVLREILGVPDFPTGDSGTILVNTPSLIVTDGGHVSVTSQGTGTSGSLDINTEHILLDSKGNISAFSSSEKGGDINLNIDKSLLLRNGSFINAEATGTLSESVDGGNIIIDSELVTLSENSQINANAVQGNGGNVSITTQGLFISADSEITASSMFGLDGNIEIKTINGDRFLEFNQLPDNFIDETKEIITSCNIGSNQFAIAGQGGLPENPGQYLRDQTVWQDLRLLSNNPNQLPDNLSTSEYSPKSKIVEAQTWKINQQGNVELLANIPSDNLNFEQNNHKCSG